jgi:hypothetical protein
MIHNDEAAIKAAAGITASAVGVATPAVITDQLADQCSDYITSVVLMVSVCRSLCCKFSTASASTASAVAA